MKYKTLILLLNLGLLVSCSNTNKVSSSTNSLLSSSSNSVSSSEKVEEDNISKAIAKLKQGYELEFYYRGSSNNNSEENGAKYFSKDNKSFVKQQAFIVNGQVRGYDTPFYYGKDDNGLIYRESLSYTGEVYKDYRWNNGSYYDSCFDNPFTMLDKNNLIEKDNKYYLPSGYIRYLADFFGFDISSYTNRDLLNSEITFEKDEVKAINLEYKRDKNNYECSAIFTINSSGDIEEKHQPTLQDNSSDNEALISAFNSLSNKNYTLTYELIPGEMNLTTAQKAKYYCTGEEIYIDNDLKYSIPGLSEGDYYYKKDNTGNFSLYVYNSESNKFERNSTNKTYKNALPVLEDINPLFFNYNNGKYEIFDDTYSYSIFNALLPELTHNSTFELGANNVVIEIDNEGYPVINLSFLYDLGLVEEESIKITFSNVGTTSIPTGASSASFDK